MPRRYHRPPAVKRRKTRRPGSPAPYEDTGELEGGPSTGASSEELSDEAWDASPEVEESVSTVGVVAGASQASSRDPVRHIQRDYSYVRSELTRIAVLAVIIVIALAVVAILR